MRILAIEREMTPPGDTLPPDLLRREAAAVWALQQQGILRDIWFTTDHLAVVMLECPDGAGARRHLATLPLVQAGMIDFMVHELAAYDGYERLFNSAGPAAPAPKPEEPPEY